MDIGAGITFGNGVGITKQPTLYFFGTLGGSGTESSNNLVVDSSGNIIICGNTDSGVLLAKYDSNGSLQWQKLFNPGMFSNGGAQGGLAIDNSGNIYLGTNYSFQNSTPILIKLDSSGTVLWGQRIQYDQNGAWIAIAIYSSGNPVATGYAMVINGQNYAPKWAITKYPSAGGAPTWWKRFGDLTTNTVVGRGIVLDSSDNVYVTGYGDYSGINNLYVAKFNSSGAVQWQQRLYTSTPTLGYAIALDTSGNVYVTGVLNISSVCCPWVTDDNLIIAKYNNSGTLQWQRSLSTGGVTMESGYGIAVDSSGNVYVTGSTSTSNVAGSSDMIIAKYDTSGTIQWQRLLTGISGNDLGQAIKIANSSDGTPIIYVSGYVGAAGNSDALVAKLPVDGSGLGTFTLGSYTLTYSVATFTSATTTLTSATSTLPVASTSYGSDSFGGSTATATFTSSTALFVPAVPGAPTVGTATATSDTTATVTFTAPANNGYSTITSYTATSSPAGGTGTLSQAGSGTINVTGLTGSTSYTFTVTATNSIGTSSPSAASNSVTTSPTPVNYKAIFGYGSTTTSTTGGVSITNLVSNTGVVATDTTGVGTARTGPGAAGYGSTGRAIFAYGCSSDGGTPLTFYNQVTNTGVMGNDTSAAGTARFWLPAASYGTDKAILAYGYYSGQHTGISNLISNTGVIATDSSYVGTGRSQLAAAGYGTDKAIFGYGYTGSSQVSVTNLVSNTGVVASDTTGVGTGRSNLGAAGYGTDKAIFGYGYSTTNTTITNLVSNTGVVATDSSAGGTARRGVAAARYGTDTAIFGYGLTSSAVSMTNLVTNIGSIGGDGGSVGTARQQLAAASYGT
jgi:hypothetical protein